MGRVALAVVLVAALAVPASSLAKGRASIEQTISPGASSSITVTVSAPASFSVVLRVPTQGRARLFLLGRRAPRVGPLIDTKTHACRRAAATRTCRSAFEPLPAGTYIWRIAWSGPKAARVALTVRW
jgi:hypothetical protein